MPDGLSLFGLFYCLPEDLTCPFHAFLIGVSVHPQRNGFVRMAQLFRYAGYIGPGDDRYGCKCMAQLVGV